jgi:hypothetical protein
MMFAASLCVWAVSFDGAGDFQTDEYGYYYVITGGLDPGQTYVDSNGDSWSIGPDGINGYRDSGGTFRYLTDDSYWGKATQTWLRDGWFPENMSLALTMQNNGSTVYDNNGILEVDAPYGDYYDASELASSASKPGLYRGYSMSNNYDWIYAGMFILGKETTIDSLTGFFDENAGFDRDDPNITYRMNIWSANPDVDGPGFMPENTGSFEGDVFSSVFTSGSFSTFDTGVDRVFGSDYSYMTDDIFGLTYTLDSDLVLGPGIYFFSHDAMIVPVPEPATLTILGLGLGALAVRGARRRRT